MRPDDAVLMPVRVVAAVIVVVLVLAVAVLYGMPHETERYWAWTIGAPMTPLLMGAGYAAGAYFFARALTTRSWRAVALGFPPITVFTSVLLIATLLHWENFAHDHVAFWAWAFLYAVTPVLVPALWLLNRRTDPGPEPDEVVFPRWSRIALAGVGGAVGVLALVMVVSPGSVSDGWPWQLTPLTARTVAAYLALTGATLALAGFDARWRAARVPIESLIIGLALILLAIPRAWETLDPAPAARWLFLGGMAFSLALLLALYVGMQSREGAAVPAERRRAPLGEEAAER